MGRLDVGPGLLDEFRQDRQEKELGDSNAVDSIFSSGSTGAAGQGWAGDAVDDGAAGSGRGLEREAPDPI